MAQERRVRARPRISAQKLGEYLYAGPGQRERLLADQKYPPAIKTARYRNAENTIRASLVSGENVVDRLDRGVQTVSALIPETRWQDVSNRCCVQAIRGFALLFPQLPTANADFSPPGGTAMTLNVEGVAVSVYPLVLSRRQVRGRVRQGAILAVFQKTDPLEERERKAAAEVLHRALAQMSQPDLHPSDCLVVDVFSGQFSCAAESQRMFSNISSACREIAVRWPALMPAIAA